MKKQKQSIYKPVELSRIKHPPTEQIIWNAVNIKPVRDTDGDGVPDRIDCQPYNPDEDGFFGDVARAGKQRVLTAVEDIKEDVIKGVAGEEAREKRKTLGQIEEEEEFEESKKQAKKRGERKARATYGVPEPIKKKKKKKTDITIKEDRTTTVPTKRKVTKYPGTTGFPKRAPAKKKPLPYPGV